MDTERLNEPFYCVTSVCRADLKGILTDEEIAKLDDTDLQRIADKMGDAYCDNGFWIDLEIVAKHVLSQKSSEEAGS